MTKSTGIAVALAVVVALAFLFLGDTIMMPFGAQSQNEPTTMNDTNADGLATEGENTETPGTGAPAKVGDKVSVNYVGRLQDGTVFDASANHGGPFTFTLGVGQVIQGWDQGVVGMKVGEKKQLIVPPELGYGAQANGPIPANSTLIFDVEVTAIQPGQ